MESPENTTAPSKPALPGPFRVELWVGIILTIAICFLHIFNALSLGALWRDEANTVGLATMPSFSDFWAGLQFDSFPALWLLVVRALAALGSGAISDTACRSLGLVVGLALVASLWFSAHVFRHRVPLLSLMLLGLSASVIHWGDTMRAYGFGMLLSMISVITLWRYVQRPSRWGFLVAVVAAVLAVNTLYYNAITLFAVCMGAIAVLLRRREGLNRVLLILLLGFIAACSLITYAPTMRATFAWNFLVKVPNYDFGWFWFKLNEAVFAGGGLPLWIWVALVVLALVGGAIAQVYPGKFGIGDEQRDAALFAIVSLAIGALGSYAFLKTLSYYTQPWYYLSLMALVALSIDICLGAIVIAPRARLLKAIIVVAALALVIVPVYSVTTVPVTNVDRFAQRLNEVATDGDLVLVTGWHYGITFARYYNGHAPWSTLPELEGRHQCHRYDLIKADMMREDQRSVVEPINAKISKALKSGHRLFIVGGLNFLGKGQQPVVLPPAPTSPLKWSQGAYVEQWATLTAAHIQSHAAEAGLIRLPVTGPVSDFENLAPLIMVFSGWKE